MVTGQIDGRHGGGGGEPGYVRGTGGTIQSCFKRGNGRVNDSKRYIKKGIMDVPEGRERKKRRELLVPKMVRTRGRKKGGMTETFNTNYYTRKREK